MQIFILDRSTEKSVHAYVDSHVVKIPVEIAQMLSTCIAGYMHVEGLYKPVYKTHPWTRWVGRNSANFAWTIDMGLALCREYTYRFGRTHKTQAVLEQIAQLYPKMFNYLETASVCTQPPQCVTEELKCEDPITAYRGYYLFRKARLFKWTGRPIPVWIKESL